MMAVRLSGAEWAVRQGGQTGTVPDPLITCSGASNCVAKASGARSLARTKQEALSKNVSILHHIRPPRTKDATTKNATKNAARNATNAASAEAALQWFRPTEVLYATSVQLLRQFDKFSYWCLLRCTNQDVKVRTMYKRKAQKVRPVDSSISDGTTPGGMLDWRAWIRARLELENKPFDLSLPGKYGGHLIQRFLRVRPGSRLTPERVEKMLVGDNVWPEERAFLMELLANREAALSWDFTKIGQVRPEVAPLQQIRTIPHHAWQAASFAIPKALTGKVVEMLRKQLKNGMLEPCHGPY